MRDMMKTHRNAGKLLAFAALMMSVLLLALPVSAQDDPVVFHSCDEKTGWGGVKGVDTEDMQEGEGSLCWDIPPKGSFFITHKLDEPVDASGKQYMEFDLYISDADMFYTMGEHQFEVTSSGGSDKEEFTFYLNRMQLEDGWNHISVGIGGGCDFSRVNYIRIYAVSHSSNKPYTMKIDNICFVNHEAMKEDVRIETAVPVIPVSDEVPVEQPEEQPPVDETPIPEESSTPVLGIALLSVGGVLVLAAALLLAMKKANRVLLIALAVAAAACIIVGVMDVAILSANSDPGEQQLPEQEDPEPPANTLQSIKDSLTNQTGHPEISEPSVDVETLLRVDPDFKTKEAYKVAYTGIKMLPDHSASPHVDLTATPTQNGMLFEAVAADVLQKLTIVEKDCWMFEDFRNQDTNQFYLSLDDAATAAYAGKDIRLTFVAYVSADVTFTVAYNATDGQTKTVSSATNPTRNSWAEFTAVIPAPALDGGQNGYDFFVTCTGPELIRLHAVYATIADAAKDENQIGLIKSDYDLSFYVVAEENVRAYGAQGDGASNDTDAFKAAIAAAAAKGGGTVFIPAGYYCLTEPLSLPANVALIGELEQGTANGTVLCIYHGKGSTDANQSAILMHSQSSVQNVAFWYPEQTLINGNFIPYPSTLTQCGSESVTIRNVTFVNAYFGINYGTRISGQQSNSLQYTRDIYGTCLYMGYHNDPSLDIGKLENFHFSPSFWLESGLPGTPNEVLLRTWMLRNSTGILLQRIDWTYIADIFVDGYRVGIHTSRSSSGTPNGHMYNVHLLDCYYPYFAEELSWTIASKCHFRAVGNEGATALLFGSLCGGEMVFVDAVFESAGDCAIANYGASKLLLTGCTVTAKKTAYDNRNGAKVSMINTTVSDGQDDHIVTDQKALTLPEVDYGKTVVTKPASDIFVDLTKAPYNAQKKTDITAILQKAIDDLKETGGLVYLPAGSYTVSDHIDVWAGVELRGVALWAQSSHATQIHTDFGMGTAEGTPLFTLYDGAGMRGLSIIYDGQGNAAALKECSYAIQGNGSNIYIVDVCLPTSWNGVDLATYRCDNHYVEYLWGAFLNIGIRVGAGSENGVIRDCHFTPNCWCLRSDGNWWGAAYQEIMTHGTPYVIGESKNQILYHNFTYGAYQGLTVLDGAKNVYVLSHGVDSGDISSYFAGNCTVTMINTELVNLNTAGPLTTAHYVYTEQDFEGTLNIINMAGWGPHSRGAFSLNGNGTVNVTGANIIEVGSPMMTLNAGSASVIGLINAKRTVDFIAGDMAMELHLAGNIFFGGLDMDRSIDDNGVELSGADIEAYAEE